MALRLNGSSSGYVELEVPAAAGSHTLTLPNSGGSSGQYLQTNGSGTLSWQTVATPTVIEAFGYNEANGTSSSGDTVISSFSSLDFSNYEGNLLQIFARTTIQEDTNTANAAVLYVTISDGTTTTVIAGSRNGSTYGAWGGNQQFDISTSCLYTIPSTFAKSGITLRLRAAIDSGTFWYGDQSTNTFYDNIGDGINGGIGFQYIVFG